MENKILPKYYLLKDHTHIVALSSHEGTASLSPEWDACEREEVMTRGIGSAK